MKAVVIIPREHLWRKKVLGVSSFRRKSVRETFWSTLLLSSEFKLSARISRDCQEISCKRSVRSTRYTLFKLWGIKDLSVVENKADQILDRVILSKIRITSKGNTDFSKLIGLKERKRWSFLDIQIKSSWFEQSAHIFIQNL